MTSDPHSATFHDLQQPLAETLEEVAAGLPEGKVTVRRLIEDIGEQGILLLCMILMLPFMTPLPLPGVSNLVGLLVMLLSVGVIMNRVPWLPGAVLNRELPTGALANALRRGSRFVARIERYLRPRWLSLTRPGSANRLNGIMLLLAATLFSLPVSFIPFSNFIPAMAIVLLCAGMLTRDGLFVLLGHSIGIVALIYFAVIIFLLLFAGQEIGSLLLASGDATPAAAATAAP